MKIKVCGLMEADNMMEVIRLKPDYIGFIFYPASSRCLSKEIPSHVHEAARASGVRKIGVFVNAARTEIERNVQEYQLDLVQLHGDESSQDCRRISRSVPVIKAFRIREGFDFGGLEEYEAYCTSFLFDTASVHYGGSGRTFDWSLLNRYLLSTPFFLSGGIGPELIQIVKELRYPSLHAIDVNSRFESAPGIKNIQLIKEMIDEIRN